MTLTMVEVRTDAGALLQLPMDDISDGFAVEDIDGLDPVKAVIVSSSFAKLDGAQFQSSRRDARNLIFKLSMEPDYVVGSIQILRDRLYSFFMTESRVTLTFIMSSGLSVNIVGRVEDFSAPRFEQEVVATISIMCLLPDFFDPISVVIAGNTVATTTETVLVYDGTVDTGFVFTLNVDRTLADFTVYNRPADNIIRSMPVSVPLVAGDVLTISTVPGGKGATLLRGGVESSVLYGISPYASWISLYPGDNAFRVYAEGAAVPYTIEYTNKYGGV